MPIDLAGRLQRPGSTRTLAAGPDGGVIRRTVLPGGLRVLSESVAGVRSVAFGVWIGVGSRDETASLSGASHYLEHLLFKGTRRRDALSIAAELDAVGGELNAFTAKEYTCYYARVLDNDLPLAVDVICDMVTSSVLAGRDVDSERGVILEEIAMHDDDPGDAVHDAFAGAVWPDTPLGRSVLGSVESIEAMTRAAIAGYYRRRYRPDSLVIAAAGNVDHVALVRLVKKAFSGIAVDAERPPAAPRIGGRPPAFTAGNVVVRRPTEQANLVLGMPGMHRLDDRRFTLGVLNAALGGGMSSRLFQEIREKRGLAYSVYSFTSHYADTGLFGVYAGYHPKRAGDVLELCREQLAAAAAGGITAEELDRGKGQMRGGLVLGLEDTGSRMSRLGKSELVYGELMTVDEILGHIDAVTVDDVQMLAFDLLRGPTALAAIGPYDDDRVLTSFVA
ncbi:MAG TPA: pitrilysin family protein [Mycobacteriales bacterium]|nr:pitrilysin family protein [Mycobacteriales bacterium]